MGLAPCPPCRLSDADRCRDNIDDPENNKPSSVSPAPYDDAHRKRRQAEFRGKTIVPCNHHLILPISRSRVSRTAPEPDTCPPRSRGRPLGPRRPRQLHGFRPARVLLESRIIPSPPHNHPRTLPCRFCLGGPAGGPTPPSCQNKPGNTSRSSMERPPSPPLGRPR